MVRGCVPLDAHWSMKLSENSTETSIKVNGESFALRADLSVAALIEMRGPRPPFAIEVNKRLIRRGEYMSTVLHDGDQVEIVTLVGGG
jgi:sulfur carrier protein